MVSFWSSSSEKVIWFLVWIGLAWLIAVSFSEYDHHLPMAKNFLENPQAYVGKEVEFFGLSSNFSSEGFFLKQADTKVWIRYHNPRPTINGYTTVHGVFLRDGTIQGTEVMYHDKGFRIFSVSLIGLLIFLIVFFREWRIKRWRFIPCQIG